MKMDGHVGNRLWKEEAEIWVGIGIGGERHGEVLAERGID